MSFVLPPTAIIMTVLYFAIQISLERKNAKLWKSGTDTVRTRLPILISVLILAFSAFFLFVSVFCFIEFVCGDFSLGGLLFANFMFLCPFCIYMWWRFNYVIADDEKIIVFRLFQKKKCYYYHEITYFKDSNGIMVDDLICYDSDRKKIFTVQTIQAGVPLVVQKLRQHEVKELMDFRKNKL